MSPPARKNAELFRLTAFAFADVGGHLNDLLAVRGTSRQTRAAEKAIDDSISDCFGVKRRNIPFPQQYGIVDCVDFESQYAIALLLLCDTIKGSEEQDPGPDQLLATFHRDMIMFASGIQFGRQPRINLAIGYDFDDLLRRFDHSSVESRPRESRSCKIDPEYTLTLGTSSEYVLSLFSDGRNPKNGDKPAIRVWLPLEPKDCRSKPCHTLDYVFELLLLKSQSVSMGFRERTTYLNSARNIYDELMSREETCDGLPMQTSTCFHVLGYCGDPDGLNRVALRERIIDIGGRSLSPRYQTPSAESSLQGAESDNTQARGTVTIGSGSLFIVNLYFKEDHNQHTMVQLPLKPEDVYSQDYDTLEEVLDGLIKLQLSQNPSYYERYWCLFSANVIDNELAERDELESRDRPTGPPSSYSASAATPDNVPDSLSQAQPMMKRLWLSAFPWCKERFQQRQQIRGRSTTEKDGTTTVLGGEKEPLL